MKVTLASIRLRNLLKGKTLPIFTCCELKAMKEEKEKKPGLTRLFDAWNRYEAESFTIRYKGMRP